MTSYWLSDFCSLTNSFNINPFSGEDKNFQYNSLTRLIILVTVVSAFILPNETVSIIISGILSVVISAFVYFLTFNKTGVENLENLEKLEKTGDIMEISEQGSKNMEDSTVNSTNLITLDYVPNDTNKKKHTFMLDGNKMPDSIKPTNLNPRDYLSTGDHVTVGTVKSLASLLDKNLSF